MELFGSALVPDFQEVYGLRLTEVVHSWDPAEVLLLIAGLHHSPSRYAARLQGYEGGKAWTDQDYLNFDMRNAVEALRTMQASQGRKKSTYREWEDFPGRAGLKRRERAARFAAYRKMAAENGGRVELE